jgi:hypothetical protein
LVDGDPQWDGDRTKNGRIVDPGTVAVASYVNDGAATFGVTGTLQVGQVLTAAKTADDPDGNGIFTYQWQSSADGTTWSTIGTNTAKYTLTAPEQSKQARVRVSYADGQGFSELISVLAGNVLAANSAPTALNLSTSSFNEAVAAGTAVALISSLDPDASNTFTYSLVEGAGSTDNAAFLIAGDQLKIAASPDYESKSFYAIRLRTTDQGGLSYDRAITLTVKDLAEGALPQVYVEASSNGNEADGSPAVLTFRRTGSTSAGLSVGYQLFGTAKAGSDYSGNSTGTITFAVGSATATLSLPALADGALIDPSETIIARIAPSESYTITPFKQFATATITAEGMVVTANAPNTEHINFSSFAALKRDGTVFAWGNSRFGGTPPVGLLGVRKIFSTPSAYAALKTDGTVVTWGFDLIGGPVPSGLKNVNEIFFADNGVAALLTDGTVAAWGDSSAGGIAPAGLTGVAQIYSAGSAFAALKTDGNVVAWGKYWNGSTYAEMSVPPGLSAVSKIFSKQSDFVALKTDGTIVAWGKQKDIFGNDIAVPAGLSDVSHVFFTRNAYAALKTNGMVIGWGAWDELPPIGLNGVEQIFSRAPRKIARLPDSD